MEIMKNIDAHIDKPLKLFFWVGLAFALFLLLFVPIAVAFQWIPPQISLFVLWQIVYSLLFFGVVGRFALPRSLSIFRKTEVRVKLINGLWLLLFVIVASFLTDVMRILWPAPDNMNFLQGWLSNMGTIAGMLIGLRAYRES